MFKKLFTPQEATRRLPLVKKIVHDILDKGERLRAIVVKYKNQEIPKEYLIIQAEIEGLIAELEELGCFYKDWNFQIGLVDFPAQINGEYVFLCWRSDESQLRWYHPIHEGYAGRKELSM